MEILRNMVTASPAKGKGQGLFWASMHEEEGSEMRKTSIFKALVIFNAVNSESIPLLGVKL